MAAGGSSVFISHSERTGELASRLADYLDEQGWRSLAVDASNDAGRSWQAAVAEAIEAADAVVLLIDPVPSDALRYEWSLALRATWEEGTKTVVPVLLLGAEVPTFLREQPAVRLTDEEDEEGFEEISRLMSAEETDESLGGSADQQSRLMKRLDQAVDALRSETPNRDELRSHRAALIKELDEAGGGSEEQKALLLMSVGLLDTELGDHAEGREHYEEALRYLTAQAEVDEERLVMVLSALGDTLVELEEYEAAVDPFTQVLEIQHQAEPGSPSEAATLQKLGVALVRAGRAGEARDFLARSLELSGRQLGAKHPRVAALEIWLAVAAEACDDYEAVKEVYERALAGREDIEDGEEPTTQIVRLLGLGHALSRLEDFEAARQSLRSALALAEQSEGISPDQKATICMAMAEVEQATRDLNEARALIERSIELWGEEDDRGGVAIAQLSLGWTLREMGALEEARKVLSEALRESERAFGPTDAAVTGALFMLGQVAADQGDRAHAEKRFRQAIAIESQKESPDEHRLDEYRDAIDRLLAGAPSTAS
jgi:tetratricopeptide (TPR) repeat protein